MAEKFDMLVLGSGNAGMGAAGVAQAAGKSVAVVENRDVGGTCPIRGCVPKKVLVAAAQALHQIELAPEHKITVGAAKLDWTALIEREKTFVAGVSDDFTASLESRGIKLFKGSAKFSGTNTIDVDGTEVTADKIIIATGSKPRDLPIPGFEHTINSDDILNNSTRPESLVFIGGGVIALEFSHVYARAGTQVTILEAMPQLLPRLDVDLVTRIKTDAERIGINVVTDAKINSIKDGAPDFAVEYEHDGETKIITAAAVANGAGRVADVEHLNLEAANVAHERGAIKVDEYLRSQSNPDVYVAGDVLAYAPQLSPVA
ncbi:MAG: NAD(P)/FAD-dependent oxidoreductase, partial [Gammaproteobacteria bacterium]|nr:NAD(P)/FAD-dependent oxidoreductase [Gammaproteobacteria bacterium]